MRAVAGALKRGGRHVFYVILFAEGATKRELEEASLIADGELHAGPGYERLMTDAGFEVDGLTDVTGEYLSTLENWIEEWTRESYELIDVLGASAFEEQIEKRRRDAMAVHNGLLKRILVSGSKR